MEQQKWLLDTDIGGDSDDCMALAWILSRKDIDLLGVSTVCGMSDKRAAFVDLICRRTGRDIPVRAGNSHSLDGSLLVDRMEPDQKAQIDRWEHAELSKEHAVEMMRRVIEANPHKVTLCAIGQLTNIALLFSVYPHIPSLLRDLVIMSGRWNDDDEVRKKWGYAEFNVLLDPYAASIVLRSEIPDIWIAGVELTGSFWKETPQVIERIQNIPYMAPIADGLRNDDFIWFHDALTLWAYTERNRLSWRTGRAALDLRDPLGAKTQFVDGAGNCHLLCREGTERFFDCFAADLGFAW